MVVKADQRHDQRQIEQDRRRRIDPEFMQRIQNAAQQRHQANQHEIGNGQPRQGNRKAELVMRNPVELARQRKGHRPGEDFQQGRHHDQRGQQHRQRLFGKADAIRQAIALGVCDLLVEHGDEGGGEGAFGKQRAEHVGQAKRHQKRVGGKPRAHIARKQRIAHQPQHAAGQSQPANGAGGL